MRLGLSLGLSRAGGGGGAAAFDPADLFTTEQGFVYDLSDASTVFTERTSPTTPASHFGPIGTLLDKSGNGNHATPASDAGRPEYNDGGWLTTDDIQTYLGASFTISQPFTRIAAFKVLHGQDNNDQFFGGVSGNAGALYQNSAPTGLTGTLALFSGAVLGQQGYTPNDEMVIVERHNGASSRFKIEPNAYTSGNAGTTLPGGVRIGRTNGTNYAPMRLYRAIEIARDLTDEEIASCVEWCQAGIPTPTILDGRTGVPALKTAHVNRSFGVMCCFNLATFMNAQVGDGIESPNTFNPTALNMDQWLDAIVASGATYVVPVFKHHDGFCLWPSTAQPYNISASSWYAANGSPNLLQQFYTNARGRGLDVIPYVSIWDKKWEIDNSYVAESASVKYRQFQQAILAEVAALCPDAAGIWTDGWYWNVGTNYRRILPEDIWDTLYSLYPNGLLIENNHLTDADYTDIVVYEEGATGDTPGGNTTPAEKVATIYGTAEWFWQSTNTISKTAGDIQTAIAAQNAKSASYLLSVGPDNTGQLPAGVVSILEAVGA